jgi:CelD/BcsL family acetyltransferase involved in cellulose biosynthesis
MRESDWSSDVCSSDLDSVDYYISLKGTWEQYLQCLDRNVRHDWQRRSRKLIRDLGPFALEVIVDRPLIQDALSRFVAIEQSGWKANAGVGVAKDEKHLLFYRDLLSCLAEKGQAYICFIKTGEDDVAAVIAFIQKDVIYGRHITYSPVYMQYSPGILILAEFVWMQFGGAYHECDFLAMKENHGSSQNYKARWATGRRQTICWTGYRIWSRMLPLIIAKRAKVIANNTFLKQKADPAKECRHPQES